MVEMTDKKSESPVCECMYHSACVLESFNSFLSHQNYTLHTIQCTCGAILFQNHPSTASVGTAETPPTQITEERVDQLRTDPAFRAQLKAVKKQYAERSKALRAAVASIRTAATAWKQQYGGEILTLKNSKKQTVAALKQSTEVKAFKRATAAVKTSTNRFKAKYSLTYRHLALLRFPLLTRYGRYRERLEFMLARRFRIGI